MTPRTLQISFGLVAWGGCIAGALSIADLSLGLDHSICGPWGCGPPTQALIACHLAWLVGLTPLAVLLTRSRHMPRRIVRATGLLLATSAITVLLAMLIHQRLVWWPQAGTWQRPYFWHRYGFSIATAIDFPVVQALLVGVWLESTRGHRRG